ncbi:chromosome segregation SMC family protein, partial [Propionibacterium sp.]|uniref:chromosome segregation SMC family protein n=1 Tax=Propionibacterium sp. TaxID=1977903 RepID=UPI0039E7B4B4
MYLKSLALRGFKSFASATTLNFEPGITAIVGPNGSGKSNIVDALAWVMGEQGAKHLRGAKMEDVIFAGTAGRAPLGRAEVTLTIDNTDGALPIEYTEVTLTRTLFRSGSSEYAINGQTARLLDVQELLSDTGMGREMHVIVGQGQLEQILASNPEMRRGYIEEAAGVLKHRRRREKAVRKLESTGTNLDRLTDLIAEIRRQLKPLGRQAAVARKAGIVQAELRDARARLLADDLTTATLALESDRQAAEQAERIRAQAQARLEAAQREEQRAEQALAEVTPALSAAQQHLLSASTLGERNQTTTTLSAERMRRSGAQPARTPGRDPQELEAQAARAREDEAALRAGLAEAKSELSQAGEARQQAEHAHVAAEAEYGQQLRALADHREGLARLNGQLSSLQSRLDAGREENARLAHRRDEALHRAEEADREYLSLESSITGLGEGESQLDADYEQAGSAVHSAEQQLEELDTQQVEVDREVSSLRARLEALRLGLQRDDGAAALLDTEVEGITSALSGELGVQPGWEAALAAALGRSADAVVARDPQTAREGLDRLRDAELGRARIIIARGQGRPSTLGSLPDGAHRLVDLVTAGPELSGTLEGLLGTVVAVPDLSMAAALLDTQPELVVVTSGGELVSSWFAEGGSGQARSTIELQAEVTRSSEELHAAEKRSQQLRFARQPAGRAVAEATAAADACLE